MNELQKAFQLGFQKQAQETFSFVDDEFKGDTESYLTNDDKKNLQGDTNVSVTPDSGTSSDTSNATSAIPFLTEGEPFNHLPANIDEMSDTAIQELLSGPGPISSDTLPASTGDTS